MAEGLNYRTEKVPVKIGKKSWNEIKTEREQNEQKFFKELDQKITELKLEIDRLSGFYVYGEDDGEKYGNPYLLIGSKEVEELMQLIELSRPDRGERSEGHQKKLDELMARYKEVYLNEEIIKLLGDWEDKKNYLDELKAGKGLVINRKEKIKRIESEISSIETGTSEKEGVKDLAERVDIGLSDYRDIIKEIESLVKEYLKDDTYRYLGDYGEKKQKIENLGPLEIKEVREIFESKYWDGTKYAVGEKSELVKKFVINFLKLKSWYEEKYGGDN